MNHDATHCLDFCCDCPETCYRAELDADLRSRWKEFVGVPLSYAHLYGTEECKRQSYLTHEIRTETHECVKPTQQWIPCNERLPEKPGQYLCNVPMDEETTMLEILTYGKPMIPMNCGRGVGRYYTDSDGDYYWDGITAWMPLPKPWEGGDTE